MSITLHPARVIRLAPIALYLAMMACSSGEDTAKFYGTWTGSFSVNGQTVTIISIHDAKGFRSFVSGPFGRRQTGSGTFSASNGRYTSSASPPNNSGSYSFVDDDTVVFTNSRGESLTMRRTRDQ